MPRVLVIFLTLVAVATGVQANCVDIDVQDTVGWTVAQRQRAVVIAALSAEVNEPITATWATRAQAGKVVRLCAAVADLSSWTSGSLQTLVQGHLDTTAAAAAAAEAARLAALEELQINSLCQTATFAELEALLDTHHNAIQANITAMTNIATAQTAMTSQNTRQKGINRGLVRCLVALVQALQR